MELSGHSDLQIVVNTSLQTVSSMVFRTQVSLQRLGRLITHQSRMTLGLLATMTMHPAIRRCTPEHWPYYKVSMSSVCSQCYKLWVSYLCNCCSGWVHSKCSGLQNAAEYRRIKDWVCRSCNSPPTLSKLQPPPIPTQAVDGNSFTIMKFNANGIGNKLMELGEFIKRHNVKVAVIQESKLSSNSKTPKLHHSTKGLSSRPMLCLLLGPDCLYILQGLV